MAFPQQVDTTYTKLFVGGLRWETTTDKLREYFSQFGEITEAIVIMDRQTGRSKGYGFVTFSTAEGAAKATANPYPNIDGRRANCNLASLGAKPRGAPASPQAGAAAGYGAAGFGYGAQYQGGYPAYAQGYGQQPSYGNYPYGQQQAYNQQAQQYGQQAAPQYGTGAYDFAGQPNAAQPQQQPGNQY
eukprot:c2092_g1_i1.p1 GENE.c2092_g1_i1~~c2092_g1_i1.p1  ORF type:complete len:187 (-),score=39.15 c2092_g1_i1:263-823(-)